MATAAVPRPRIGWRETWEPGIYRRHRVGCQSSKDRKPRRSCSCPFQIQVPGHEPGRFQTVTIHGSVTEARRERHRLLGAGRTQTPPHPKKLTLNDWFAEWIEDMALDRAPSTIRTYRNDWRRVGPRIGSVLLAEIDRAGVRGLVKQLAATVSSAVLLKRAVIVLSSCLSGAVDHGKIDANPCLGMRLGSVKVAAAAGRHDGPTSKRVLNVAELHRLYDAMTGLRQLTLVRVAAETGLRRGELIGLQWRELDLNTSPPMLHVRRNVDQDWNTGQKIEKDPKNHQARTLMLGENLTSTLRDWQAESGGSGANYVWPGGVSGPMSAGTPTQVVRRGQIRAGLVDEAAKPLVTLHGLRHGCGSLMLQASVPLIAVSHQLGHGEMTTTARIYAHLVSPRDQLKSAADALGKAVERNPASAEPTQDASDDFLTDAMQDIMQEHFDELESALVRHIPQVGHQTS